MSSTRPTAPDGESPAAESTPHAEPAAMHQNAFALSSKAWWLTVISGLLAGLVAFSVGEAIYKVIPPALVEQSISGNKVMLPNLTTNNVAATKNGALAFGVLGLCLGACLGMAGGHARRSTSAAVTAGLFGSVLGFALGAGLSLWLLPMFLHARHFYSEYDMLISLAMHGVIWGALGAAAGLAFAVGLGKWRLLGHTFLAGLVGAVLGAILFELIGAVLFTSADTDEPISETWPTRLMARLLVTIGTATAVLLLLPNPPTVVAAPADETATPEQTS